MSDIAELQQTIDAAWETLPELDTLSLIHISEPTRPY